MWGDGIYYTALPLLAATLTRDPLRVAAVDVASQLPWLLFALPAGALVDRWDRRRVLWLTDAYRGLVLAALAVAVVAGWASIPVLAAAGFLLGTGGTLFVPASLSIIPAIVSREPSRLERANGRLAAAQTVGLHFLGPPAGGALFSLARSAPFVSTPSRSPSARPRWPASVAASPPTRRRPPRDWRRPARRNLGGPQSTRRASGDGACAWRSSRGCAGWPASGCCARWR